MDAHTLSGLMESFCTDGYCVLRGAIDDEECRRYVEAVIKPAMLRHAGIAEGDPSTWLGGNSVLKGMSTQGSLRDSARLAPGKRKRGGCGLQVPDFIPGAIVRNSVKGWDPLADSKDWDAVKQNAGLVAVLDAIHAGRRWEWIYPRMGMIHVRFPVAPEHAHRFHRQWHVDGKLSPHFVDSREQSVVVLPLLRAVQRGGGNTVVLRGSHAYMARLLKKKDGLTGGASQYCSRIAGAWPERDVVEVAPCEAGDVLVMHPFLIHSSGLHSRSGDPLRLAFNWGTRWREGDRPDLEKQTGALERSIRSALDEEMSTTLPSSEASLALDALTRSIFPS